MRRRVRRSSSSTATSPLNVDFPIAPAGDSVDRLLRSFAEHPLYSDPSPTGDLYRAHVAAEIGRAYPGTGRDATGRATAAPAIRPEEVRPFDPRNAATGGGGSSGGEVQVKAHARDGGETPVKAHTRSAPGTGGSAKNSDHPGAAWSGLFPGEGGSHHHDRNKNQICPPQAP